MNVFEAVETIAKDQYIRRRGPRDYRRMVRALVVLGLSEYEQEKILQAIEYHNSDNEPYIWAQEST